MNNFSLDFPSHLWYTKVMEVINDPVNPLVQVRSAANLSQADLAELSGMSRMAIIRYEQGLYVNPSLDYITALAQARVANLMPSPVGTTLQQVVDAYIGIYKAYRAERIDTTIQLFKNTSETKRWAQYVEDSGFWEVHPFISFRKMLAIELGFPQSQIHFCMLTCFHPGQLDEYEKRPKTYTIPKRIRNILLSADLPVGIVEKEVRKYLKDD